MGLKSANNFNEIYTAYYKKSFLYVKSYVHIDEVAEDIVSDSLIKLWEQMNNRTVDPIAPYLFTILKNRALDYLKHQKVKVEVHDSITLTMNRELELRTTALEASDPNEIFSGEVQRIVKNTLESLPKKTREIFFMSRFNNKSHKEIANLYGMSVKGVDYHIMQSVKELRLALKDYLPFISILAFLRL